MILWDFAWVETRGLGWNPSLGDLRGLSCFYIFQNCIIRNFGRILNSLAILFLLFFTPRGESDRPLHPLSPPGYAPEKNALKQGNSQVIMNISC